jgi:hypothetical protein
MKRFKPVYLRGFQGLLAAEFCVICVNFLFEAEITVTIKYFTSVNQFSLWKEKKHPDIRFKKLL